jgi:hypothetical protein
MYEPFNKNAAVGGHAGVGDCSGEAPSIKNILEAVSDCDILDKMKE